MVPSSVVHTGVKSFGCENSTTQLIADPIVEPDFAFGRLGFEIWGGIANLQRHGNPPSFVTDLGVRKLFAPT